MSTATKTNDGGHAFLQHGWSSDPETIERMQKNGGMSLRDWFAGQVLATKVDGDFKSWPEMAAECYRIADAMLIAREKGGAA